MKKRLGKTEYLMAVLTFFTLVAASLLGLNRSAQNIAPHLKDMWPDADRFENAGINTFQIFRNGEDQPCGYVTVEAANGFGGPLKVAVSVDTSGKVVNAIVVEHKETPSWFTKVMKSPLMAAMKNKVYTDPFELENDVDGISGATYTTRAIVQSVKTAARQIAIKELNLPEPDEKPQRMQIGFPEFILILLLVVATSGIRYASGKNRKRIRWLIMLSSMAVLGFMVNHPLTLVDINKFLMGYWPNIHYQIYWYLLIFGVLLIFLTTDKNVYCQYICPFGAVQESLAVFARAKRFEPNHYAFFKWLRRGVVWLALFLALIFRNPGISSYEVYSTLFSLSGTNRQVLFLMIVLVFALFVTRPWCRFLCPVPAFEDYLRFIKNTIRKRN